MAAFEESFLYPLILLLIGAGVSGVIVSWLTNRWHNHRKALESKVDIVSKMSEAIGHHMANVSTASEVMKTSSRQVEGAFYENLNKLFVDSAIIESNIESYFPGKDVKGKWISYVNVLMSFYYVTVYYFFKDRREDEEKGLRAELESVRNYLRILERKRS